MYCKVVAENIVLVAHCAHSTCICNSRYLPEVVLDVQCLTHWGCVTHICVSKLTIISSDNGLSPGRRQAIICTNAGILFVELLGTKFSEFLIKIIRFSVKNMHLKMLSAKWLPFCLGLTCCHDAGMLFIPGMVWWMLRTWRQCTVTLSWCQNNVSQSSTLHSTTTWNSSCSRSSTPPWLACAPTRRAWSSLGQGRPTMPFAKTSWQHNLVRILLWNYRLFLWSKIRGTSLPSQYSIISCSLWVDR